MAYVEFPLALLHESSHDWNIAGSVKNAGQTDAASVDVRSDGGGFWTVSLNDIQLWERSHALLWRAIRQIAAGGVNPLVVSRSDQLQPWPSGAPYGVISFDDGMLFDDGAGFDQVVIDVVTSGAAARRATSLVLKLNVCGDLLGGESFAIAHPTFGWRMYEIATVLPVDVTHVAVTFNPPLREAVADGTAVEFDRPRCVMKLQTSSAMDLNLTVLPNSRSTAKFVETKYQ